MKMWKHRVIKLFKSRNIILPYYLTNKLINAFNFNDLLNYLYHKNWMVFCQKASSNHYANVNYLGRYIKRPSIADSKLKHYAGNNVIFKYLDHKTDTYLETSLSVFDFIGRLIQHIPDVNFRMIRYYGILANRVRSKLIPILYKFLGKTTEKAQLILPSYSSLLISNFNLNPMIYSKCNNHMIHVLAIYRNTASHTLLGYHNHLYGSTFC